MAILTLLSIISPIRNININEEISETNRYLNSKGEPINLSKTNKHLRLELKKVRKYSSPIPIEKANLMISEDCMK